MTKFQANYGIKDTFMINLTVQSHVRIESTVWHQDLLKWIVGSLPHVGAIFGA